jgi:hypothetical protein
LNQPVKRRYSVKALFKHQRVLFMILSLSVLILASSCGGGGGGGDSDDGGGDGGGQPLSQYGFGLSPLADKPLTLSATLDSQPISATLEKGSEGETFNGTYDIASETITMRASFVKVTTTGMWDPPLNTLWIRITNEKPIIMPLGNNPTQGTLTVGVGGNPSEGFEYTFTITITGTGVLLEREGFVSKEYTWDLFGELLGTDALDWEKQASFASSIINFIFNQLNFDINAITMIEENDTVLEKKSVTVDGDTFLGTPPAGHAVKGTLTLSCPDGNVGPGGDFSEVFHDYWVNDPLDDIDYLYNGSVSFVGFLENSDAVRGVITSIGFVPNPGEPGGVLFDGDGLTIYETEETSGVFSINDAATITITGGYSIMFFEPTS